MSAYLPFGVLNSMVSQGWGEAVRGRLARTRDSETCWRTLACDR